MANKNSSAPVAGKSQSIKAVVLFTVGLSLLIPPMVFCLVALSSGLNLTETTTALIGQFSSRKQNLLMVGLLSLLPVGFMLLVIWLVSKIKRLTVGKRNLAIGGASGILTVDVWMNVEYWPTFLPQMTYAGFPHGLEFVLGPIFYAPVMMLVGMAAVALARKRKPLP